MEYVFVTWTQNDPSMPREVYSEIDASRREVRKVEVFADGRYGFASSSLSRGSTQLGLEPLPPVEEIAREKEFNLRRGTAVEFEEMWKRAGGGR